MNTLWLENLLAYSLQLAALVGSGVLVAWLLRLRSPKVGLRFWQVLTSAAALLPLIQLKGHRSGAVLASSVSFASETLGPSLHKLGDPSVPTSAAILLGAGVAFRLGWLAIGLIGLRRVERRSEPLAPLPTFIDDLQRVLGTSAGIRLSDDVDGPATIGSKRPLVLLPRRVLELPHAVQRAIVCHELLHVRRRDWLQALAEEAVCAVFWFHPAARVLASRLSLSREMVIDQETIAQTGDRRAYAEALLAFADATPTQLVAVAPLIRRRHLSQRIALVSQEVSMSRTRLAFVLAAAAIIVAQATATAVDRFPISSTVPAQAAYRPGDGVSLPRVIREVKPDYTPAAMQAKIQGSVTMSIVVLSSGDVGEVAVVKSLDREFGLDDQAVAAARQWKFEPGKKDGRSVPVQVELEMRFTLKK